METLYLSGVAVDGTGSLHVTGSLDFAFELAGEPLVPAGGMDAFIAKFDAAGSLVRARLAGDAAEQSATAPVVDSSGHLFIGGTFEGTLAYCGSASPQATATPDGYALQLLH